MDVICVMHCIIIVKLEEVELELIKMFRNGVEVPSSNNIYHITINKFF